jgi:hypothetical protein
MINNVFPDKEKVKSIIGLITEREKFVSSMDYKEFSTIVAENYYEIIKELSTALLLSDGLKAMGENAHKETIDALSRYGFSEHELSIMNDLRIKRNKSSYEGKPINSSYIENKREMLLKIIEKLKGKLKVKIK